MTSPCHNAHGLFYWFDKAKPLAYILSILLIGLFSLAFSWIEKPQPNMENRDFSSRREMIKGNWTCSGCGASITELPFAPDGERPLYCRDCHQQRRASQPRRF